MLPFKLRALVCALAFAMPAMAQQEPAASYSTSASSDLRMAGSPAPTEKASSLVVRSGEPVKTGRAFPKVEIFFGYAYANVNLGAEAAVFHPSGQNYNGVQSDLKMNLSKHVGLLMDLGGEYGSSTIRDPLGYEPKLNITHIQYLFGPEFATRRQKVDVFAHTLIGFTCASLNELKGYSPGVYADYPDYVALVHSTSLAFGVGGGIEKNWRDFVAVRVIEVDYIPAHANGNWQSTIRAATGMTVRF